MSKEDKTILYRRHLPHWQLPGATIFLTWRLYGSLPREALERLAEERRNLDQQPPRAAETQHDRAIRHHKQMLALTDSLLARSTHQPRWLSDERIAHLITEAFYFHADRLYTLHAFVVMPNHVHVLLTPLPVEPTEKAAFGYVLLRKITQSLKGYTAREANRLLGRTGQPFWQDESYDHWIRSAAEAERVIAYIESDPVRSDWQQRLRIGDGPLPGNRTRKGFPAGRFPAGPQAEYGDFTMRYRNRQ